MCETKASCVVVCVSGGCESGRVYGVCCFLFFFFFCCHCETCEKGVHVCCICVFFA